MKVNHSRQWLLLVFAFLLMFVFIKFGYEPLLKELRYEPGTFAELSIDHRNTQCYIDGSVEFAINYRVYHLTRSGAGCDVARTTKFYRYQNNCPLKVIDYSTPKINVPLSLDQTACGVSIDKFLGIRAEEIKSISKFLRIVKPDAKEVNFSFSDLDLPDPNAYQTNYRCLNRMAWEH